MVTNEYSREWCSENYDKNKEDFYISNTRSLILSQWKMSIKHAIVTVLLLPAIILLFGVSNPIKWLVAMQIGYALYGVLTYCHNDMGAGGVAYLCSLIYFINRVDTFPAWGKALFYITGFVLLFTSIIPTILYRKTLGDYGEKKKEGKPHFDSDEEEFEAWKRKYYNSSYDNYRNNSYSNSSYNNSYSYEDTYNQKQSQTNSYQRTVDPNVEKARALFADFGTTFQELKKRYRKLALEYHPDHGGENDLFAAIVNEYEYIKKMKFPDQR